MPQFDIFSFFTQIFYFSFFFSFFYLCYMRFFLTSIFKIINMRILLNLDAAFSYKDKDLSFYKWLLRPKTLTSSAFWNKKRKNMLFSI